MQRMSRPSPRSLSGAGGKRRGEEPDVGFVDLVMWQGNLHGWPQRGRICFLLPVRQWWVVFFHIATWRGQQGRKRLKPWCHLMLVMLSWLWSKKPLLWLLVWMPQGESRSLGLAEFYQGSVMELYFGIVTSRMPVYNSTSSTLYGYSYLTWMGDLEAFGVLFAWKVWVWFASQLGAVQVWWEDEAFGL